MSRLYKYSGTIAEFSYSRHDAAAIPGVDLVLWDMPNQGEKAPVRLEALGGLADYINAIEMTDAEERYLTANWYYDSNLFLHRIEIPSSTPGRPAKIVAQLDPLSRNASIFGPKEYINTPDPQPMAADQMNEWYKFRLASADRTGWR